MAWPHIASLPTSYDVIRFLESELRNFAMHARASHACWEGNIQMIGLLVLGS
jgi:hypothetical protein